LVCRQGETLENGCTDPGLLRTWGEKLFDNRFHLGFGHRVGNFLDNSPVMPNIE
jgi:hypothetical protein